MGVGPDARQGAPQQVAADLTMEEEEGQPPIRRVRKRRPFCIGADAAEAGPDGQSLKRLALRRRFTDEASKAQ